MNEITEELLSLSKDKIQNLKRFITELNDETYTEEELKGILERWET